MKYIIISVLLFALAAFPFPSYAHVSAKDNSMQGFLHIDPDDKPIANEKATFKFTFSDKENKFNLDNCVCQFEVLQHKKILFTSEMTEKKYTYIFPEKDVYQIIVSGTPSVQGDFQPFRLTYDIRVEKDAKESEKNQDSNQFTLLLIAIGVISSIIIPVVLSFA